MKQKVLFLFLAVFFVFFGSVFAGDPVFVYASDKCYVDENADSGGDGSDDDPYQDIDKALDENCDRIVVLAGEYDDNIVIGEDISVEGKSRDTVTVTGSVTMKDGAMLSRVTVSGKKGVNVNGDASVEIEDSTIVGADVGITTVTGSGKVTVRDTNIHAGNKGMYLQSGITVTVTGCEIYDNDEEGIDVRSNVAGSITNNEIFSNGESGIEVIFGKSDLTISDNKIKKNKASGITAQYYKGTGKSGAVKIKNNTITDNDKYGMNCQVPSGGNPGVEFWEASLNMSSNKLSGNKNGKFAPDCSLSASTISDASMTHAQKVSEEQAQKEEAVRKLAEQKQQLKTKKELADEEKQRTTDMDEQEKNRELLQKDTELHTNAQVAITAMQTAYDADMVSVAHAQKRNAFLLFLIGPRVKDISAIAERATVYKQGSASVQKAIVDMTDQTKKHFLQQQLDDLLEKRNVIDEFLMQQQKEFSLFGWMFD
jgi:parallel beta-helix repeat protein